MKLFALLLATSTLVACESTSTTSTDKDSADAHIADSQASKEERNKKTVADFYDAIKKLDTVKIMDYMADDVVDYNEGSMEPARGKEAMKASAAQWMGALESFDLSNVKMVAEGDEVWNYGTFNVKFKEDMMGMPTKGKTMKMDDVDIFTFNDEGKITSHRAIQSMYTWLGVMGIPTPANK